jgi:hypothetical protein
MSHHILRVFLQGAAPEDGFRDWQSQIADLKREG